MRLKSSPVTRFTHIKFFVSYRRQDEPVREIWTVEWGRILQSRTMHQIAYFGGTNAGRERLRKQLANLFEIQFEPLERSLDSALGQYSIFDFNLDDTEYLLQLKDKLKNGPKDAKAIFVVEQTSRLQETRALAL